MKILSFSEKQCRQVLLISMHLNVHAAFDKPQATITEDESPNEGTVADIELPRIGKLFYTYKSLMNTQYQAYSLSINNS